MLESDCSVCIYLCSVHSWPCVVHVSSCCITASVLYIYGCANTTEQDDRVMNYARK